HRQDDVEGRAGTQRRMYVDVPAVQADQAAGDRQAEPGATLLPGAAVVDLLEFVEDSSLILGRDTRAGVLHGDIELVVGSADVHLDRSGVGEFYRIANDVEQNLGQAALVAAAGRQVVRNGGLELDALFLCQRAGRGDHGLDQCLHGVIV